MRNKDEMLKGISQGEEDHHKDIRNKMIPETRDTRRHVK